MTAPTGPSRSDEGLSLLELIMAVAIMATAFIAVLGALGAGITGSVIHREQASSDVALRADAEGLKVQPYLACANAGHFTTSNGSTVTSVEYWHPAVGATNVTGTFNGSCAPATDSGVQRVTLQNASSDGRVAEKVSLIVRKQ